MSGKGAPKSRKAVRNVSYKATGSDPVRAAAGMQALRDQYVPGPSAFERKLKVPKIGKKKPLLTQVVEPYGEKWVDFASYFVNEKDHIYKVIGTVKTAFYDAEKDTATITIDFDVETGKDPGLDYIFNHACVGLKEESPFKFPWTYTPHSAENKPVELKVATPYGQSGQKFVQEILDEDGNWLVGAVVEVRFKFSPYTMFPDETTHGVGCKMQVPLDLLNRIPTKDLTQDPESFQDCFMQE